MPPNVYTFIETAAADTKFKLTTMPFWVREANIHILTENARYGSLNIDASYPSLVAGSTLSFVDFDLNDMYFMNSAAGVNTKIVAVCIKMTEGRKEMLGVE